MWPCCVAAKGGGGPGTMLSEGLVGAGGLGFFPLRVVAGSPIIMVKRKRKEGDAMSPARENLHEKLRRRKLTLGVYRNVCGSGGAEKDREHLASTAARTLLF